MILPSIPSTSYVLAHEAATEQVAAGGEREPPNMVIYAI